MIEKFRGGNTIEKPNYYTDGIECLEYIQSHNLGFIEGNVIKYVTRAKLKNNEIEDLKKARYYLDRLIKMKEGE